jgi:hypothetical protein
MTLLVSIIFTATVSTWERLLARWAFMLVAHKEKSVTIVIYIYKTIHATEQPIRNLPMLCLL